MKYPALAPSILSADFSRLGEEVFHVEQEGADLIHVDVMDGHFVPNLTFGPSLVRALRQKTRLPLDVHMMVTNPDVYIGEMADAGATIMTVHVEACPHLHRTIQAIRDAGMQAGVAVNPATSLSTLDEIFPFLDLLLIMSVNPGFGGQAFIPQSLDKISRARTALEKNQHHISLEVDGGIKVDNARAAVQGGADILVAGSAIFSSENYRETMRAFRAEMGGADQKFSQTIAGQAVAKK